MENKYIDMHIHTNNSDGSLTVESVLKKAEELQLDIISITDHNTVSAYDEMEDKNIRNSYTGKIVPGIEITTTYNGEIIEILGYGINTFKMKTLLKENLCHIENRKVIETQLTLNTLKNYGVYFSPKFEKAIIENPEILFNTKKGPSKTSFIEELKKYPQNAKFFESQEQMERMTYRDFSRQFMYNPKSKLYVNQSQFYISLEKTIDIIHQAGGLAFLAHLYEYSPTIAENLENITNNYPLDGIECYYTTFTKEQSQFLEKYCKEYQLYKSCGSDFHGYEIKPNNPMGLATEKEKMNESIIREWIEKVNKI